MANLDTTINVKADSSGVSTGLEPGKRALKDFGKTADEAGRELSKIGDGGAQSAQKVEGAAKSLISSIQRTTAVMDSGARGSVEYYKALANQRGIDVNVLKPYLDQLDAVKAKQAQAAAAMLTGSQSLDKIGMSAAATTNALRGVPAQFTDIVVSLQGGQAPLTVLLQQGGQLKDMFGGVGNAAKALSGYVMGLINPYTLVAAAVAGTAIAYEQGAAESRAFEKALILSGNQAGTTTGQMMAMAASIDRVSGTQGNAAEALAIFATNGKVASENLEQFTLTAIRFEKVTGTSIEDTAKKFAELKKAPLEATLKLNESMGYLTQGIYDQIKALTEQGKATEAAALAQSEFDKATAQMATDIERNLGIVQRSWNGVTGAVKEAWDAIKGIGRDAGLEGQVAAAQKMVDIRRQAAESIYGNAGDRVKLSEAENQLKGYQELLKNQQLSAKYAAERSESVRQGAEWDKLGAKYLGDTVKMEREIAAAKELGIAAGKTAVELAQREADIRKSYEKKEGATKAARVAVNQAAKEDLAAFKVMEALRTKADGDAMKRQEEVVKELEKTMEAYAKASEAGVSNAIAAASAAETELANYGLLKSEVQSLTLVQLEQARESAAMAGEDVANIEKRIDAQKRLIAATKGIEGIKTNEEAAKLATKSAADAAAEWKKTSDSINSTLTDALMRGFESGKDFAKNLRDTVVNMFKTLVLRPIISAVMSPISGALTGAMGLSGAANAAGGVSAASTAMSGISLAMSSFGGSFMSGLSTTFASGFSTLGLAVEGGLASIATGTATGISAGIGQALGAVAGPLAIGAGVLAALGAFRSTKQTGTGISGTLGDDASLTGFDEMRKSGYLFGGPKYWDEIKATDPLMAKALKTDFAAIKDAATGAADALGLASTEVAGFNKAFRIEFTGDKAKDEALYAELMAGTADDLAETILGSYKEAITTVTEEIASGAFWDSGESLTSTVTRQVKTSAYTPSEFANEGETASQTLTRLAVSLSTVNASFDQLGYSLIDVGLKGASTASKLIDAFGGAEAMAATMSSYYQGFYTEAERTAKLTEQTSAAFTALGLTMPALDEGARAAYRAMVELAAGQDLTAEANRNAYASILSLNGAMNQLAPTFDAIAEKALEAEKAATEKALESANLATKIASSERRDLLDARAAKEAAQVEALKVATEAFATLTTEVLTLRESLLLAGDAAGAVSNQMRLSQIKYSDFMNVGGRQGFNAGAFNSAYAIEQAKAAQGMGSQASANALNTQNVAGVLGELMSYATSEEITRPIYLGIRDAIVQASGTVGEYVVRDSVDALSNVLATAQAKQEYGMTGPGLLGIYNAQSARSGLDKTQTVGGVLYAGDTAIEYAKAVERLNGEYRRGTIDAKELSGAMGGLQATLGDLSAYAQTEESLAASRQAAAEAVVAAGFASINYYFGQISSAALTLAQSVEALASPLGLATAAIGRLNSVTTVFQASASAALSMGSKGMDAGSAALIGKSTLIAEAASIASAVLTTSDAAAAAKRLAESDAFANLSQAGIRDAAPLLDGLTQYNAEGFEKAFLRINNALVTGKVTDAQYQALFTTAIDTFQGVDVEANAVKTAMQSLADAMGGFADKLLIDQQKTTLTAGQTLAEIERQYGVAYASAMTGDSAAVSNFQSLAGSMLNKGQYANQGEYNAAFGRVYGDSRNLENIGVNTVNQSNNVVSELKSLNTNLSNRVESLEKNLTAALATIAKNTSKTAQGIEQQNTVGVPVAA